MNMPGFTGDASLILAEDYVSARGIPAAISDAAKLVPQQSTSCLLAC